MPTQETNPEPIDQPSAAVCASPAGVLVPEQAVQTPDFVEQHRPALEQDEVRHNLILANLGRLAAGHPPDLLRWTLGPPGACAVQTPGYPIVLGELTRAQCCALADQTRDLDYPGVVGPDRTAQWFAGAAIALGLAFLEPIPQQIQVLRDKPNYPGAPGHAWVIGPADVELFADWTIAFMREAVPHDPVPGRERLAQAATEGRHLFWIVDGEPVSIAGIVRRTRQTAAIASVYTPPALRGRGYAGSVTAAVVERIFAEGKSAACLYTDLRNPASNRCYRKIGFEPACRSWHYLRARAAGQQGRGIT
jgi:RimJ/RimL family protein N-acetyltransferase